MEITIDVEKCMKYLFFILLGIAIFLAGYRYGELTTPTYILGC